MINEISTNVNNDPLHHMVGDFYMDAPFTAPCYTRSVFEQRITNARVEGSSPVIGLRIIRGSRVFLGLFSFVSSTVSGIAYNHTFELKDLPARGTKDIIYHLIGGGYK